MQRYGDWSPTPMDPKGLNLDDKQDWFVLPVMRTRDSGPFDESNFEAALELLGGESDTLEVHRFGHWGPGWFEIVIIHPSREAEAEEKIVNPLANYPLLDDEKNSAKEAELVEQCWDSYGARELVAALAKNFHLAEATRDWLRDLPNEALFGLHRKWALDPYLVDDSSATFSFRWIDRTEFDRGHFVAWIREQRALRSHT